MVSDVGVVQANPEPQPLGQLLPLAGIAEDAFQALADERLDAEGLDLLLRVDAQLLADLDLDGQAVGVPAGLALAAVAAHGLVAGKEVLDGPGEAVARMRQPVGRGRAFIEDERRPAGPGGQRFLVDAPLFPASGDLFFELGEGNGAIDGLEHGNRCVKRTGILRFAMLVRFSTLRVIDKALVNQAGPIDATGIDRPAGRG